MLELASVWTILDMIILLRAPPILGPIVCVFLFPWIPLWMSFLMNSI